jgi:hypothetical protein
VCSLAMLGAVPTMLDVAVVHMSLGETVSITDHDGVTARLTLKEVQRMHTPMYNGTDTWPLGPPFDPAAYDHIINDGSRRYVQIESALRKRLDCLLLERPGWAQRDVSISSNAPHPRPASLILDAFAFITQPKFAEHRRTHLWLLNPGLKTAFERRVFADFWLRQGNSAKSWLTLSDTGMEILSDATWIIPRHIQAPSQEHPIISDMNLLFDASQLDWISRTKPRPLPEGRALNRFGPSIGRLNIRILLRRIRERQYARLAKGDVDGLVGVTPEGIEHARELRPSKPFPDALGFRTTTMTMQRWPQRQKMRIETAFISCMSAFGMVEIA